MSRFQRGGPLSLKPENALKRAEELVAVGQKQNALQTLHDTITNKRQQRNWTKALEQVMFKYIDLCVDMKQGRKCKDALINYRNTCQQVNVGSLEDVIKYLLKVATDKAQDAQKAAQAALDVEDLDADASPEEMMLSYVSGEKSKDRTDRELVTPWFKFLWETYRNVLDILRNNSRLEGLYAMASGRAFQFCLTYKRTTEFRRLCDILRNHLSNLIKYRDQGGRDRTDLTVPASWELYVDMRFDQLRTACDLELWAEAFRSVEDIQGLMGMTPKGIKAPKAQLMATYYAKLTQIFTKSENRLYNAYAWYRLFMFSRLHNKGLTQQDIQTMAANVVLSALSIMPYDQMDSAALGSAGDENGYEAERAVRMAAILGFNVDRRGGRALLSRAALLADIDKKGLLALCPPQVKEVYAALEGEFNPLQLCQKISPLLENMSALNLPLSPASPVADVHFDIYKPHLQQVAVARMVRQLSEVYSVMRVSSLSELAPYIGFGQAEQLIVDGVRHGYFHARFDHKNNTVHFGGQELESERVKGHIATMARRLARALTMIEPQAGGDAERERRRGAAVQHALETAEVENKRLRARKVIIESRKEAAERAQVEREREAKEQRQLAEALAREQEELRKQQERAKREAERIQREMEEREQEELKAYLAARGKKVSEGEKLDVKAITKEAVSEQLKQQQELQRKLAKLGKQMDHLERAKREEEAPLLQAQLEKGLKDEEEFFAAEQERARAAARTAWEHDVGEKHRLAKMAAEKDTFAEQVTTRRAAEFAALKSARTAALARRREERRAERDLARRREYVRRCRLEIEERRRAEEEEARCLEEEKKKREAAERQRKLDELAERQRQREAEIEAKARAEREAAAAAPPAAAGGGKFVPAHLRRQQQVAERPAEREPAREPAPAAGGPPRDRSPPRGERPAGAWRPSGGRREEEDRPPAPRDGDRPAGSGSAWRPSFARGSDDRDRRPDDRDRRPDDRDRRPDDRDRRDDGPPRSGAYRPPVRRDEPPPSRGGSRW